MKIGILECDHVDERLRDIAGDYRDMFTALFKKHSQEFEFEFFDVCEGQLPRSLESCDAYLCTGSRYSAYDNIEWINRLKDFLREGHSAGVPFVGICFGHQVLAEALGGKTVRSPEGWGVGIQGLEVVRPEVWMKPKRSSFKLHFMHQDYVQRLPDDGILLGTSAHCPNAMFRVGNTALGIQAHPELTSEYSEALLLNRLERIGETRVRAAQLSLSEATDDDTLLQWIVNFITQVTP
jgi:GMP synthase-like glutamine amidotransferase